MRFFLIKVLLVGILLGGALLFFTASISVPNLNSFDERRVVESTKIYDRTGKILLYDVHGEEKRTVIPSDEIPRSVKNATIALEDSNFYQHYGVRPLSLLRAFLVNLTSGSVEQGGSTITQQLVKNTLLTPQRTIFRKIKELIVALKIERRYSKDEILNFYLNQIPYGNSAYGIEAAAESFFGKRAEDLTALEAAYLVSLPKAPSYYSPYGKHTKELDGRAQFTLKRMKDLGFLTDKEYEGAKNQKVKFAPARSQGIIAPHFVIEVREELNKKFGEDAVAINGFKVTTTLNADLQQKTEEVVDKYATGNEKNFNAKNEGVVAIDPKTGDIWAMVGSRDYFNREREGNFNIATTHRQPGSSFKPFVYATAFKKGYTPETVLFDLTTQFSNACAPNNFSDVYPCYSPENYDHKFRGPITLRNALAQSVNIPAVKLVWLAGAYNSIKTAERLGLTTLEDAKRYGLTLVLGGGEVKLVEMVGAYGVFANDGLRNPHTALLSVEDKDGNVLEEFEKRESRVMEPQVARQISSILSDNEARTPLYGANSQLYFPGTDVAAKTGTTNDYRDAWVLGYTPTLAAV